MFDAKDLLLNNGKSLINFNLLQKLDNAKQKYSIKNYQIFKIVVPE